MIITLDLTDEEVAKLEELMWIDDEGPEDEGWRSEIMESLAEKVTKAIKKEEDSVK